MRRVRRRAQTGIDHQRDVGQSVAQQFQRIAVDDALRATRAAIEEGYVVGAGTAFLRIPAVVHTDETDVAKGCWLNPNATDEIRKVRTARQAPFFISMMGILQLAHTILQIVAKLCFSY